MKNTLAIAFVSTICLFTNITHANEDASKAEMKHAEMKHAEMKHAEMKHAEMKHAEMKHAEMKHGEMNHGEMNHGEMNHGEMYHGEHGHSPIDVTEWQNTPSLTLTVQKDLMAGWNLHIEANNFAFTPKNVNLDNLENEGHGHVYINGKKQTRVYSPWLYLNNLPAGKHTITVSLNANDHGPLYLGDKPISASVEIVQE